MRLVEELGNFCEAFSICSVNLKKKNAVLRFRESHQNGGHWCRGGRPYGHKMLDGAEQRIRVYHFWVVQLRRRHLGLHRGRRKGQIRSTGPLEHVPRSQVRICTRAWFSDLIPENEIHTIGSFRSQFSVQICRRTSCPYQVYRSKEKWTRLSFHRQKFCDTLTSTPTISISANT